MNLQIIENRKSHLQKEEQHKNKSVTCACCHVQGHREEERQVVHDVMTYFRHQFRDEGLFVGVGDRAG